MHNQALNYQRPVIRPHAVGRPSKAGFPTSVNVISEVDQVSVEDLLREHGSPLFVMSESSLRAAYRNLHQAMRRYFPEVVTAWSYKTNWLRAVCAVFHQEGAWAEVVSEFEYQKALDLGIKGEMIVYNGPYKPKEALRQAFQDKAQVNLDSIDEMYLAEEVAGELGLRPEVGLRVNLSAGAYPTWSRFGFNYESGEAQEAAEMIINRGRLNLVGLHCHIGTFVLDPNCYTDSAAKIGRLAHNIQKQGKTRFKHFNLGGGFASTNTLVGQYQRGETSAPRFEEYAAAAADGFQQSGWSLENLPRLILETGRALVDEAGYLLTSVHAVKRLPGGKRAAVMDAGVNLLFTSAWYNHEISPGKPLEGDLEETVLYGPLCMNIDVLRETVLLPTLRRGDPLVIRPVGAYNMTQWLQFIRLRPRVVMVGPGGRVDVIRESDDLDDLIGREPLPGRLAGTRGTN